MHVKAANCIKSGKTSTNPTNFSFSIKPLINVIMQMQCTRRNRWSIRQRRIDDPTKTVLFFFILYLNNSVLTFCFLGVIKKDISNISV